MKLLRKLVLVTLMLSVCSNLTNAQSISDILGKLGGGNTAGTIGSIVEGVLSKSDLQVSDLVGNWKSTGPAVTFKSDNLLKKAGGAAVASSIENKLSGYYSKLGLNGAVLTVNKDGTFQLSIKSIKLSGTIELAEGEDKGVFLFNFKALGKVNLGKVKTYIQKTSVSMDVMFDASKLLTILQAVGNNVSSLSSITSLLSSYDGLCVGFAMKKN